MPKSEQEIEQIFSEALRVSEPCQYDSLQPEIRTEALTKALELAQDCNDIELLMKTETSRQVTLRAVCDPWSATRKKTIQIIMSVIDYFENSPKMKKSKFTTNNTTTTKTTTQQQQQISSSEEGGEKKHVAFVISPTTSEPSSSSSSTTTTGLSPTFGSFGTGFSKKVEEWLVTSAEQILSCSSSLVVVQKEKHSTSTTSSPWYAVDGMLNLIKNITTEQEISSPSLSLLTRRKLLRFSISHCTHPQEVVRETATEVVVILLGLIHANNININKKQQQQKEDNDNNTDDDNNNSYIITLEQVEAAVVDFDPTTSASSSLTSPATIWWQHHLDDPSLIALGQLALADKGIGIDQLFPSIKTNQNNNNNILDLDSPSSSSSPSSATTPPPLLKTRNNWACSELASVRFACAQLFTKTDFRNSLMSMISNTNENYFSNVAVPSSTENVVGSSSSTSAGGGTITDPLTLDFNIPGISLSTTVSSFSPSHPNNNTLLFEQVETRLKLAIQDWLSLSPSSASSTTTTTTPKPWTLQETAAIAASDLLKKFLPMRYRRYRTQQSSTTSFTIEECVSLLSGLEKLGSNIVSSSSRSNSVSVSDNNASNSDPNSTNNSPSSSSSHPQRFDVRRACAQLLPFICQYLVITAPTCDFIVEVMKRIVLEKKASTTTTSNPSSTSSSLFCCTGKSQISGTGSCCSLQNLIWFLIIRVAFEEETFLTQNAKRILEEEIVLHFTFSEKSLCPRVQLLIAVYGKGLGFVDNSRRKVQKHLSNFSKNNNTNNTSSTSKSTIITTAIISLLSSSLLKSSTDVRWIADWLRLSPQSVLKYHSHFLLYCVEFYVETNIQDLIFTALHDVAHVQALLLSSVLQQQGKKNQSTTGTISKVSSISSSVFLASTTSTESGGTSPSATSKTSPNLTATSTTPPNNSTTANATTSISRTTSDPNETSTVSTTLASPNTTVTTSSAAHALTVLAPFLFSFDSRFAPPSLQQDGSDRLADGSAWIKAMIGSGLDSATTTPSSNNASGSSGSSRSSSSVARMKQRQQLRRDSIICSAPGANAALHQISRWSSCSIQPICFGQNCPGVEQQRSFNDDALFFNVDADDNNNNNDVNNNQVSSESVSIEILTQVSASLMQSLLVTGKSSNTIELGSLLRAADATRSVIRALGSAVIVACCYWKGEKDQEQEEKEQQQKEEEEEEEEEQDSFLSKVDEEKAIHLLTCLMKPWLLRLDTRRKIELAAIAAAAASKTTTTTSVTKASESNWDDDDDDEDEDDSESDVEPTIGRVGSSADSNSSPINEFGGGGQSGGGTSSFGPGTAGFSSTSVTYSQEVEAVGAAFKHVIHVLNGQQKQHQSLLQKSPEREIHQYEPQRIVFITKCVKQLRMEHPESCKEVLPDV